MGYLPCDSATKFSLEEKGATKSWPLPRDLHSEDDLTGGWHAKGFALARQIVTHYQPYLANTRVTLSRNKNQKSLATSAHQLKRRTRRKNSIYQPYPQLPQRWDQIPETTNLHLRGLEPRPHRYYLNMATMNSTPEPQMRHTPS